MPRGTKAPSEVFRSVMEKAKKRLLLESDDAADFKHNEIRGNERAASLSELFRERLPDRFGVEKGEAIDFVDARTGQLDFIIYDRARCAPIRAGRENLLLPCEALYCAIEVKTKVTLNELKTSYEAAKKVKALKPFKKTFIAAREGGVGAEDRGDRCLYVVFGYSSDLTNDADWAKKEYARLAAGAKSVNAGIDSIDRLFVLDRGIVSPKKGEGKWEAGDASTIFLEFYLHILNFLGRESKRREPVDWQIYGPRSSKGWTTLA
jgi:hypothetical protein